MGGFAPRALNPDEESLLAWLLGRRIAGPVRRTAARDRLRRVGLIEPQDAPSGDGETSWLVTDEGRAYLAQKPDTAA